VHNVDVVATISSKIVLIKSNPTITLEFDEEDFFTKEIATQGSLIFSPANSLARFNQNLNTHSSPR
jgi:hypothetical protein